MVKNEDANGVGIFEMPQPFMDYSEYTQEAYSNLKTNTICLEIVHKMEDGSDKISRSVTVNYPQATGNPGGSAITRIC